MVLAVQTYPLLLVQKLTPPYWEVLLTRGKFGLVVFLLGHFTPPFGSGVNALKMSQQHYPHYKLTPCQWDFPIRRGKLLYQQQGVSLYCHYHSWDFLPLGQRFIKKWSKVGISEY